MPPEDALHFSLPFSPPFILTIMRYTTLFLSLLLASLLLASCGDQKKEDNNEQEKTEENTEETGGDDANAEAADDRPNAEAEDAIVAHLCECSEDLANAAEANNEAAIEAGKKKIMECMMEMGEKYPEVKEDKTFGDRLGDLMKAECPEIHATVNETGLK